MKGRFINTEGNKKMQHRTIETAYTEQEWMKHVERHAGNILKRYIKRKIKKYLPFVIGILLFYIVYALFYAISGM